MNEILMRRLQIFLSREDNGTLMGQLASDAEIAQAEQRLGVRFHEDYRQFIRAFGGAYAGLAIHAFSNGSSIGRETVVELTLSFREQLRPYSLPFAELLQTGYVISLDGSGDPIAVDANGQIWTMDHDTGESRKLADSFEQLIEDCFVEW